VRPPGLPDSAQADVLGPVPELVVDVASADVTG
jgi:hypothetical protein